MKQFDLEKNNIFMKFIILDKNNQREELIFLYSDNNGIQHLDKVLEENPLFSNLLTPIEILTKLAYEIAGMFSSNQFTGLERTNWRGKMVKIHPEEIDDFSMEFKKWKNQLEGFLGKDNIFQVSILYKKFNEYVESLLDTNISGDGEHIFNYVNNYRLQVELQNDLNINESSKRKIKL